MPDWICYGGFRTTPVSFGGSGLRSISRSGRPIYVPCAGSVVGDVAADLADGESDEDPRLGAQSRGTYGKRRIKAALLAECEMIVNHKLVASIMAERGLFGLPRRKRRGHPM
ncbi:transposase, partial [Nocardia sp. NPDC004750]